MCSTLVPEECLSHTNPECRCSDRQTMRCSEERAEQRDGEVGKKAGTVRGRQARKCREREREEREGGWLHDPPFISHGRRMG